MTNADDLEQMSIIYNIRLDGIKYITDFLETPKIGNYILNLDSQKSGGTHWVAVINLQKKLYYFDPFGLINSGLKKELENKLKKEVVYNNLKIQMIHQTSCGPWSLIFLKEAENIKNEKDFNDAIKETMKYSVDMKNGKK